MTEPGPGAAAPAPVDIPVPPGYAAGAPVPWWVKFGVKLAIGNLPVPARAWRALGLRRHSFGVRDDTLLLAPLQGWMEEFRTVVGRTPRTLLEVGPGAMVLRAPAAAALGYGPIWFLDVEDDAPRDLAPYRRAAEAARAAGLPAPDLSGCATHLDVLAACNARLLIGGADRLAELAEGSVDLVTSSAVLEHVRRDDMLPLLRALRRVTAADGLGLHGIDLHDHLGGRLRHLGFSPGFWEGPAVARAALYCNRLGLSEFLDAMQAAGFATTVINRLVWPEPPIPPGGVHPALARRPEDNLICAANLRLRPV